MGHVPLPKTVILVVLAATAVLAAWVAWGSFHDPETLWAPGNLSRAHAGIVSCTQCHEPFHGPSSAKCVRCHSEERFMRESSPDVAQRHVTYLREPFACLMCHTEHRGG